MKKEQHSPLQPVAYLKIIHTDGTEEIMGFGSIAEKFQFEQVWRWNKTIKSVHEVKK